MILKTPPATEPITLEDAKAHLRVTSAAENDLIDSLIAAAREYAESYTKRALITQTWKLNFDEFPSKFDIPKAPLISVSSIKYLDDTGTEKTLATDQYRILIPSFEPGKITPAFNVSWPSTFWVEDCVTVEFIAGYGDASKVPKTIKTAMKLYVEHFFANRSGGSIPSAIDNILYSSKVFM